MIDELKKNIDSEIGILREISYYSNKLEASSGGERKMIEDTIKSLVGSLKVINKAIPTLVNNVSLAKPLTEKVSKLNLEKVSIKRGSGEMEVIVSSPDKTKLLKELSISENLIKRIGKKKILEIEKNEEFKGARGYLKFSNKIFLESAQKMTRKGYFRPLYGELKKANIDVLFETYIAMMFLTTLLSFFGAVIIATFFVFFGLSFSSPFIFAYSDGFLARALYLAFVPIIIPIATFVFLYYYPVSERDSLAKKIDQELPFAVIHMSAISGSGIEPSQIFRIIGMSKEYPYLRNEIRKVLNQINVYGYDLVTALNNVSKSTPSARLAELLSGLSTTITSGGSLEDFFEKRSESLLNNYRLEREKYTRSAEIFMDIYISVVIAAPMILMILLVLVFVSGFDIGFTPAALSFMIIGAIALINILFLAFLNIKQPTY